MIGGDDEALLRARKVSVLFRGRGWFNNGLSVDCRVEHGVCRRGGGVGAPTPLATPAQQMTKPGSLLYARPHDISRPQPIPARAFISTALPRCEARCVVAHTATTGRHNLAKKRRKPCAQLRPLRAAALAA
jgi:hypothetical protein